jgi:hypothetical protein
MEVDGEYIESRRLEQESVRLNCESKNFLVFEKVKDGWRGELGLGRD